MPTNLQLQDMNVAEKIKLMEDIWSDLSSNPNNVNSPEWHSDVLQARKQQLHNGALQFNNWEKAKQTIRERTQC